LKLLPKGKLRFYVSNLICCKSVLVYLQISKRTPGGTCIPGWEPLLCSKYRRPKVLMTAQVETT